MNSKLNAVNRISALFFLISSLCLLFIPFIKFQRELPVSAHITASVFWAGNAAGGAMQIFLLFMCRKYGMTSKGKNIKIRRFLLVSLVSFIVLVILALFRSKNVYVLVIFLFLTLISLQISLILKRKECLM